MITQLLALAVFAIVTGPAPVPPERQVPIPAEAVVLAQECLTSRWIPGATKYPDFWGIDDLDPATATLGEPFCELELRGHNIVAYRTSEDEDPMKFAGVHKYVFPILASGEDAGAVVIIRNRDEDGKKFSPELGEYMLFGYYPSGHPFVEQVNRLRSELPENVEIVWVWFIDANVRPHIVVRRTDGTLLCGTTVDYLRSVSELKAHMDYSSDNNNK